MPDEEYQYDYAYIDSDVLVYHGAFGAQKTYYDLYQHSDPEFFETHSSAKDVKERVSELNDFLVLEEGDLYYTPREVIREESDALACCDNLIERIKNRVKARHYVYYLTGQGNYREEAATLKKYKGNRPPKPYHYAAVKRHLISQYGAKVIDGCEADDAVAVGMSVQIRKGKKGIACSIDKDLLNVPGHHYGWKRDEFYVVSEYEADLFLYQQILAGDPVDNYAGIPRVGAAKAAKILNGCASTREMYEAALEAYRAKYGDSHTYQSWDGKEMTKTPEELLAEHAHLAYIMRRKDQRWTVPE